MARRLHLVTGHRSNNRSDDPVVLYCGYNADAARAARDAATNGGDTYALADSFTPHGPQTRYNELHIRRAQKATEANDAAAREREADKALAERFGIPLAEVLSAKPELVKEAKRLSLPSVAALLEKRAADKAKAEAEAAAAQKSKAKK